MNTPKNRRASLVHSAFHEAGHAVARIALGAEPTATWIAADGGGMSEGTGREWAGSNPLDAVPILTLAGPCAEARHRRVSIVWILLTAGADDYGCAKEIAERRCALGFDSNPGLLIDRWIWEARELLTDNWAAVERVAAALQLSMRVEAQDLSGLIRCPNYLGRPLPPPRLRQNCCTLQVAP